ncbi:MAG: SurA N-terminal domain-containing protein [Proteobacteria bacterium]|nr:SurA N-terminal domain-containing protein [Pseudomonadota bacterium]
MVDRKIIAKVEDEDLYDWQLKDEMQNYAYEVLKKDIEDLDSYELTLARNEALEKIIGSELFYLEAKSAGITADENEINKFLSDFMKNFSNSQSYEIYLAERAINKEDLKKLIEKNIIKDKFLSALLKKIPPVTSKDAEKYYEKIKDKLSLPPKISLYVAYIYNPTDEEREKFKNALGSIQGKKMEYPIAEKIISDVNQIIPSIKQEKIIQKGIDEINPLLAKKLMDIEESCFSNIIETEHSIEIIYLIAKVLHVPMGEEEGKKEAGKYLAIVRVKKILDAYIDMLKEKYKIEVFL